ncbi:MAG: VCBS repeat-containing protein, partial [Pirellulales bacterium]|nr:VCBS repeat-containing protein [Pirellulales bacterium]
VSYDEVVDPAAVTLFRMQEARRVFFEKSLFQGKSNHERALAILNPVAKKFPDVAAVAGLRGRILAEAEDLEGLAAWAQQLPAGIDEHSDYWFAIGRWLIQTNRHEEAIRAFGETLRRDPTDRQSLRLMVASLNRLRKTELAGTLNARLAVLDDIFRKALGADAEQCEIIAEQLHQLVRPWEATAWLKLAAHQENQLQQRYPELQARRQQIIAWEGDSNSQAIANTRLLTVLGFDIESWPLPQLETAIKYRPAVELEPPADTEMRLIDVAASAGIKTQFVNDLGPTGQPYYLYQINGCGLAAFDYDLDGRCDIYVVHSGGKPFENNAAANHLYRQLPDATFVNVNLAATVGDRGYGQGVCAADINQDGFLDLLIANIGANAIYINQGDGSFRHAPELLTDNPDSWTSSIASGDLDGDHLPEIVAANYIDDPKIYQAVCQGGMLDGGTMGCLPHAHHSAADHFY